MSCLHLNISKVIFGSTTFAITKQKNIYHIRLIYSERLSIWCLRSYTET